jgi:hypothetical protein
MNEMKQTKKFEDDAEGYAFISYSSKNQQMADSFRTLFNQNGIKTWMAPGDIPFGSTYTSTINRAIKDSSCFVLLLSESAQCSPWVLKETERAVSTGKTIFPVLLDDVSMNNDFEFMLSTSQAVAIRKIDESDEKIKQLIIAVKTYVGEEIQTEKNEGNIHSTNLGDQETLEIIKSFRENLIIVEPTTIKSRVFEEWYKAKCEEKSIFFKINKAGYYSISRRLVYTEIRHDLHLYLVNITNSNNYDYYEVFNENSLSNESEIIIKSNIDNGYIIAISGRLY